MKDYVTTFKKDNLNAIRKIDIEKAIKAAHGGGVNSVAPLGFSSKEYCLFGEHTKENGRVSLIQIRYHTSSPEMLITDADGVFLFYGKFDANQGLKFVVDQFWNIFNAVKPHILNKIPKRGKYVQNLTGNDIKTKSTKITKAWYGKAV